MDSKTEYPAPNDYCAQEEDQRWRCLAIRLAYAWQRWLGRLGMAWHLSAELTLSLLRFAPSLCFSLFLDYLVLVFSPPLRL